MSRSRKAREPEAEPPPPRSYTTREMAAAPLCLSRDQAELEQLISMVVQVVGISTAYIVDGAIGHVLTLRDFQHGEKFDTLPVTDKALIAYARGALSKGSRLAAYGLFTHPGGRSRGLPQPRLRLLKLGRLPRPSALYAPTLEEARAVDATLDELFARERAADALREEDPDAEPDDALYNHFLGELFELTGTAWGCLSPRFHEATLMTILQGLSYGMVPQDTNPRISLSILGASGSGKKKLAQYARLLAPISDAVQPASCSVAGLSACVNQKPGGGWSVTPGIIPSTSGGVCVVDDLHRLQAKDRNAIQSIFSAVAEDALIASRKAAAASYECRTALHLNANRQRILEARTELSDPQSRAKDLMIPYDLFTRMDGLMDLAGSDDAVGSAEDMIVQSPPAEKPYSMEEEDEESSAIDVRDKELLERVRRLQVLVGRLLDRIPSVSLAEVEPECRKLMRDLALVAREYTSKVSAEQAEIFNADSLLRRMANSARKFIGASARLHGRAVATKDDVHCAWLMLSYKLEAVKWLCGQCARIRPLGSRAKQVSKALRKKEARWAELLDKFGGCAGVKAEEIATELEVTVKTVQQELRGRGLFPSGGRYDIPTFAEYQAKAAAEPAQDAGVEAARFGDESDDEEPDDDEDDEEEEEAPEPVHFDDCLPELPQELTPLVETLAVLKEVDIEEMAEREEEEEWEPAYDGQLSPSEQIDLARGGAVEHLKALVFQEQAVVSVPLTLELMVGQLRGTVYGAVMTQVVWQAVMKCLGGGSWLERAKLALVVLVQSGLPDVRRQLCFEMKYGTGVKAPPEVRAAVEAAVARLAFYEEREREAERAASAEEEAAQRRSGWS